MGQKKAASFAELEAADGIEYVMVEKAYGETNVRLGSLSSGDMIEWTESNDNPVAKREAGLRLLVKSVVDEEGNRLPGLDNQGGLEKWLAVFRKKSTVGNNKVIEAALNLNGLGVKRPNASSETASDSSSTGSDSPSEK